MENVVEVQRRWKVEFGIPPPTRVIITRIRGKFEVDGTVQDVLKGRCGRKGSSISNNPDGMSLCWECTVAESGYFEHVRA